MKSSPSSEKLERKPVCSNKDPPQPKSKINLKNKKGPISFPTSLDRLTKSNGAVLVTRYLYSRVFIKVLSMNFLKMKDFCLQLIIKAFRKDQ